MPYIRVTGRTIEVDDLGFIIEPTEWDTEVAHALAENRSLDPMGEDHWQVVVYIREYYERYKTAPMLRSISKRTGFSEKKLKVLFPSSCRECMCLVAGLTQPTG
jgi:tRNA 2-thiouridine synthesizing protein E